MRKGLIAVLVVGLAGCATYSEMQQKPPRYEADTAKSPSDFVDCVTPKLVEIQAGTHSMKDGSDIVVIVPIGNRGGDLSLTVTASPTPTGSHVALRDVWRKNAKSPAVDAIQQCL